MVNVPGLPISHVAGGREYVLWTKTHLSYIHFVLNELCKAPQKGLAKTIQKGFRARLEVQDCPACATICLNRAATLAK